MVDVYIELERGIFQGGTAHAFERLIDKIGPEEQAIHGK
jgi:hypothetical protein